MFNKLIFFVGTYEELTKWLNGRGYFVDDNRKKLFFKNVDERSQFGPFWIDGKNKSICAGEGLGYPINNTPTYPDSVMFEVKTEGFTQKEINDAFYKAYKHLDRLRHRNKTKEIKDFIIEKNK
ncbi:hypothetical protein [Enterococcus sp. DIV0806c]|uniref:hypothetical protein n=1 Tax=unclassified Enterococcus TaxID=2608891 RepID=UPI003F234682